MQAGHTSTVEVLKLMEAFVNEDNFTVWSSINNCLAKVSVLVSHTDYEDEYKAYGRRLLANIYQRLGWVAKPGESHLDTMLRGLVIGRLVAFGETSVVEEAKKRFHEHTHNGVQIPADLRSAVYKAVLSVGDEKTYNSMLKVGRKNWHFFFENTLVRKSCLL